MKILDRLPIPKERTSLRFGGRHITVHPNQILVWVSVHLSGVLAPEENIPRFPALLDTGNNFAFSVQDRHLREWAGIDPGLGLIFLEHVHVPLEFFQDFSARVASCGDGQDLEQARDRRARTPGIR